MVHSVPFSMPEGWLPFLIWYFILIPREILLPHFTEEESKQVKLGHSSWIQSHHIMLQGQWVPIKVYISLLKDGQQNGVSFNALRLVSFQMSEGPFCVFSFDVYLKRTSHGWGAVVVNRALLPHSTLRGPVVVCRPRQLGWVAGARGGAVSPPWPDILYQLCPTGSVVGD